MAGDLIGFDQADAPPWNEARDRLAGRYVEAVTDQGWVYRGTLSGAVTMDEPDHEVFVLTHGASPDDVLGCDTVVTLRAL